MGKSGVVGATILAPFALLLLPPAAFLPMVIRGASVVLDMRGRTCTAYVQ